MTGGNGRLLDWGLGGFQGLGIGNGWLPLASNRMPLVRYLPATCLSALVAATKNTEKHTNTYCTRLVNFEDFLKCV